MLTKNIWKQHKQVLSIKPRNRWTEQTRAIKQTFYLSFQYTLITVGLENSLSAASDGKSSSLGTKKRSEYKRKYFFITTKCFPYTMRNEKNIFKKRCLNLMHYVYSVGGHLLFDLIILDFLIRPDLWMILDLWIIPDLWKILILWIVRDIWIIIDISIIIDL